jgi:MoaA/NifB/PqqE/SkfB family radical SAM enzyme
MRITSRCNQKCLFCRLKAPGVPEDYFKFSDMTLNNFVRIVDRFRAAIVLLLTWGEPFLNKDVFNIIEYAHAKKMYVTASSNGAILNDKIEQIVRSSLSELNISLDASNPSDYERLHGAPHGSFYNVLENIRELSEKRKKSNNHIKLTISHIFTKKSYKTIPDMIRLAEELEVDGLVLHNLIPYGLHGFSKDQSLYEGDSEAIEVIRSVERIGSKLDLVMPIFRERVIAKRHCRMPFTTMTIDGSGGVYVCCEALEPIDCVNILHDENVWNNPDFRRMRKMLTDCSEPLPETCKICPLIYAHKVEPRYVTRERKRNDNIVSLREN